MLTILAHTENNNHRQYLLYSKCCIMIYFAILHERNHGNENNKQMPKNDSENL